MRFWDSSALVACILEEQGSPGVRPLLADGAGVSAWWASSVECASAIFRARRSGRISEADLTVAEGRLVRLLLEVDTVPPIELVRARAGELLRTHALAAADALQLAAALAWADGSPRGRDLVSLDGQLRAAAQAEGFRVLPA